MIQKISNYIFGLPPKKLAVYLVVGPLLLFLGHTVITVIFRNISEPSATLETIVLGILFLLLAAIVLIWSIWLRGTVFSVDEAQLGLPRKWFRIAYVVFYFFILFNVGALIIEYLSNTKSWIDEYMYLIYSLRELINFAGIMIAYPLVCHYAARAASSKKNGQPATFLNALPFTLLLVFGSIFGTPFLHNYFSSKTSTNTQIVIIYAIAFGLCILLFVVGFIAAITGLV